MGRVPFEWNDEFDHVGERVDDFFDRVFGLAATPRYGLQQTWRPSVDVYRLPDCIVLVAEMPGVGESDFKVIAERRRLRIAGLRPPAAVGDGAEPLQLEIDYGPFECCVALPAGADAEHIRAELHAGLLTVRVPLREPKGPFRVQVDDSEEPR